MIKSGSKDFSENIFEVNRFFLFLGGGGGGCHCFHRNMKQHNCFNIDSNQKYESDFWRSCNTEDWSNDAKIQISITWINYILKYIGINLTVFTIFKK